MTQPRARIGRWQGAFLQLAAAVVVTALLLPSGNAIGRVIVGAPPPRPGRCRRRTTRLPPPDGPRRGTRAEPSPLVGSFVLWRNKPSARKTQPVNPEIFDHQAIDHRERFGRTSRTRTGGGRWRGRIGSSVGDSVTFGFNVDQPDPYPRRLRRSCASGIRKAHRGAERCAGLSRCRGCASRGLRPRHDLICHRGARHQRSILACGHHGSRRLPPPAWRRERWEPTLPTRLTAAERWGGVGTLMPSRASPAAATPPHGETCRRVSVPDIEATIAEMARRADGRQRADRRQHDFMRRRR